jgi:thiol-disulfide isomerase/thioredoxin
MHPDQAADPPAAGNYRWFLLFLGVVGAILLFLALVRQPGPPVGLRHPGVGDRFEQLSVQPLVNTDQAVTLDDLEGKVTLINFWGPWCRPCLMEMPELLELEKKHRAQADVRFLLVAYPNSRDSDDEDLRADATAALDQLEGDPAIYYDPQRHLIPELIRAAKLHEFGFPTTVLLDRQGTIRGIWTSYDPSFVRDMSQALDRLVAEKGPKKVS